jgi:hypothetical protein
MLRVTTDDTAQLVVLEPDSALTEADFTAAAETIDPLIERDALKGLVIYTEDFPGWDSFNGLVGHLKFVRDHHRDIGRVALVTDSRLGDIGEKLASHFVSATIQHFPYDELDAAKRWIGES